MSRSLYNYKRTAQKVARELGYGDKVISAIKVAETETAIARIMKTAREAK